MFLAKAMIWECPRTGMSCQPSHNNHIGGKGSRHLTYQKIRNSPTLLFVVALAKKYCQALIAFYVHDILNIPSHDARYLGCFCTLSRQFQRLIHTDSKTFFVRVTTALVEHVNSSLCCAWNSLLSKLQKQEQNDITNGLSDFRYDSVLNLRFSVAVLLTSAWKTVWCCLAAGIQMVHYNMAPSMLDWHFLSLYPA